MRDLEAATKTIGRRIFALVREASPTPLEPDWWDMRLMEWSMGDERLKYQALRFIDVLPALKTPNQVAHHLREYFAAGDPNLPLALRWGAAATRVAPAAVVAAATRINVRRMARRFIAGASLPDTLAVIRRLHDLGMGFTLDVVGEATASEAEADAYMRKYLLLVKELSARLERASSDVAARLPVPRINLSLKLSALYSQFDPVDPEGTSEAVKSRLRPILRAAKEAGAFIHVDMEQYAYKDLTLRIVKEVLQEPEFADFEDAGLVIQTYLKDAERDLADLAAWAGRRRRRITVRLVKGAYWDYERVIAQQRHWPVPVFEHKWETDANFERLAEFLIARRKELRPAFASHNVRSLAHSMAAAEEAGVPLDELEFQLLHGMAEPIKRALVKMGCRVRVYVPSGHLLPGMGYLVRRILENTSNESFLRQSFIKHASEEQLLAGPAEIEREWQLRGTPKGLWPLEPARPRDVFSNEPDADFSQESNREAMRAALARTRDQFGRRYPLVIGGREIQTPDVLERRNPSRISEVVGATARASRREADEALDAASRAFVSWRATPAEKRAALLVATAAVLRRRRFELAAWEVHEVGKTWREADADVCEAVDYLEYYGREMLRLAGPRRMGRVPGETNLYHYEPRGVVLVVAPWNFPLAILCGMTAAALVAGNTAIMKPARQSGIIAAKLMESFRKAGFPDGVVNYLPGLGEEVGAHLVAHPQVSLIAFTGSRNVGLAINAEAARTKPGQGGPKRVIAEMGGKNAVIVDADADLDDAVTGVAASAFGYQGQKCSAASRVIVLEDVYDVFLSRLVEHARSLKTGPAEEPGVALGPLVDEGAFTKVTGYIETGKREARLAFYAGADACPAGGYFVPPAIFAETPPSARIAQEEIFGPVLAVIRAATFQEALQIANGTEYALTGGLYSRSPAHIELARRDFLVGNLYINRKITGAIVGRQPFGGFKMSGIGSKAGGPDYLMQFLLPRTITENTLRHGFTPE